MAPDQEITIVGLEQSAPLLVSLDLRLGQIAQVRQCDFAPDRAYAETAYAQEGVAHASGLPAIRVTVEICNQDGKLGACGGNDRPAPHTQPAGDAVRLR